MQCYSQDNLNGTARFKAMSGAFGALGGDFSSIGLNLRAQLFLNNQFGITITSNIENNSNYFGTTATEKDKSFDLNQAGGVLCLTTKIQIAIGKVFTSFKL
jgi:hypothetical protein